MSIQFLKSGCFVLMSGFSLPVIATNSASSPIAVFQMMPFTEQQDVIQMLSHPSVILTNGVEIRIDNLSTTYHIPMRVIRLLESLSRLQIERLNLTTAQGQYTALKEINALPNPESLDKNTWSHQMNLLRNPNRSRYRETERGTAIRILGTIGGRQKLPPDAVYYLRNLMFEMENPNIRVHVVNAFRSIVPLHPPDFSTMQKLTSWMRELRETNGRISLLRDFHFKSWEAQEKAGHSPPDIVEKIGLPPQRIGIQSENSQIYQIVQEIAQKHLIPTIVVDQLGLALEGDENQLPGTANGVTVLADNLLNALFAVAKKQKLPTQVVLRLEELDTEGTYSSNDQVTIDQILTAHNQCKENFL